MNNMPDIVDLVLYFLAGLSVITWAILIVKTYVFSQQKSMNKKLTNYYKDRGELSYLPEMLQKSKCSLTILSNQVMHSLSLGGDALLEENKTSDMLKQSLQEVRHQQQVYLEKGLAVLASIGSTAPFIGLFGTVWGIMNALKGISEAGSAGLDVVAGPIGEALIATAMGIATAIPAVLAYNYFLRESRLAAAEMDHFSDRLQLLAKYSNYKVD
ncbi:MAG: flagellar motor protein MotA [Gammaproteobacteria bacterium]|nr:MAG: flagellar motor protein MotA [Gammaproteobacteria bacterium]